MLKLPTRLWAKGQQWAEYNEIVPAGIPLEAVLNRDYWMHVQNQLRPLDMISCVAQDGSFDVDIRLMSKTATTLKFRVIREARIDNVLPIIRDDQQDRYVVKSGGRAGGYRVHEKSTGAIIADGLDKAEAEAEKARLEAERKAA